MAQNPGHPWDFETLELLGSGAFGVVISAFNKIDESISAVKLIVNRDEGIQVEENAKIIKEAKNCAKLNHKNIVKYKTCNFFHFQSLELKEILRPGAENLPEFIHDCLDSGDETSIISGLYIQMELCGYTLRSWLIKESDDLEGVDEDFSRKFDRAEICQGLIDGVNYIHREGLIHRDLRPENVYFSIPMKNGDFGLPIKIGDFGLSKLLWLEETNRVAITMTEKVGNETYRAPEMDISHPNKPGMARYGQAVDVYAVGLIISEIFDPYPQDNFARVKKFEKITYSGIVGERLARNYPELGKFVVKLASEDPRKRQDSDLRGRLVPIEVGRKHFFRHGSSDNFDPGMRKVEYLQTHNEPNSCPTLTQSPLKKQNIQFLRELLQKCKQIWTYENISLFFNNLEKTDAHKPENFFKPSLKTTVNENLYRLEKEKSFLLSSKNLKSAVDKCGVRHLAGKIDELFNKQCLYDDKTV
ncbi:Interferon-induced, double-stranded RNA-activated protein kinase [Folsomia candida]|uniref:non-specific serine/threonine protein kinase n=1 Tax=Folsomia candida TaxID=158441 RepID=A0A226EVY9_FOLCA|nr:Interferon-induced, double-stranded RNA-activated protein kinase [Folsomia candida]